MSDKYISPEHVIRKIVEGAAAKIIQGGEAVLGGVKTARSYDEILKAARSGEKISDDMLKGLSKRDIDSIKYEMQKASAKPKPAEEPLPEPTPAPAPAPAPEKPANDPNPPGVVPIKEPAVPSVEPYKVPKWEPKEPLKPANDPVPSKPAPVETPSPKPAPVETPKPAPVEAPAPSVKPAPVEAPAPKPAAAPDLSPAAAPKPAAAPRLSPEAQAVPTPRPVPVPKTATKTPPPKGGMIPPIFGGETPGQSIAVTSGGVKDVGTYLHRADARRQFGEEREADKAREEIVNVPRPNAKDAKNNRTRQNEIIKKIHEENMAKKNIILNAIKEKKSPPSVDFKPKLKDTNPGEK